MIWTRHVLHKIEWGMLTTKGKQLAKKYPIQLLAAAAFFLLMYAIYVVISLRFFMQAGESEPAALYLQLMKMTLLLLGAAILLSRNKLKRQEYQFYFLNSAIQSVPFVLCVYFFPMLFCFLMVGLLFLPIVLGLLISGVTPSLYWITAVCMTCCVLALLALASWMVMRIAVSHFVSKTKEHLLLQTLGFAVLNLLVFLLLKKAMEMIRVWPSVYLIFLVILLSAGWLWLKGLAASYVHRMFLQLKTEVKSFSYKKIRTQSSFLTHLRQELVYFSRSAVFKEQGILFLFLVCLTAGLPFVFTPVETGWLYAFIVQYALKEILIMLPLMIGREYHINQRAIFMLNTSKGAYLLSRILFYYAINLLIYFVFIGLASMVIGIKSEGHGLASLSILLITAMAACTGFIVKISEFNKLFVIVMMIAVFSFIDMLLLKWLSTDVYLLATAYLLGSLAFYSCIYAVMLKRPVLR
ncbi:hypothetical protein MHB66_15875 [Bacillus sp. FSL L8-0167]|uniref:hypothetical protein n=1 Tax=Bacillus TaxID=1386 RepID=UPI00061A8C94|nr:hypothetical protein [Bacillus safensis]MBY0191228.1 hypothetical protein [Bacillus aerophilus]KKD41412.1 membrane protein [Bacillus safensis]MCM3450018.1 hypothetical protein [Bacillus safensis]MDR6682443.1 hypothetical protein [Bacillus safensis]MEC0947999.1 hypothetical protein [Bacillus safensis]